MVAKEQLREFKNMREEDEMYVLKKIQECLQNGIGSPKFLS